VLLQQRLQQVAQVLEQVEPQEVLQQQVSERLWLQVQ
jgi:hypothetical protein